MYFWACKASVIFPVMKHYLFIFSYISTKVAHLQRALGIMT